MALLENVQSELEAEDLSVALACSALQRCAPYMSPRHVALGCRTPQASGTTEKSLNSQDLQEATSSSQVRRRSSLVEKCLVETG